MDISQLTESTPEDISIRKIYLYEEKGGKSGPVRYIRIEIRYGGELRLFCNYDIEYYNTSPLKKALDLLLGNKET
jgi:hypothetical protein|nr:MAG TPA: hypothetical protein [Caudoviricetes sp.]